MVELVDKELQRQIIKQMLTLATNGFGLVAALAWNNVILEFVNSYVKRYFATGSGIVSLLIYAVLITALAVSVTYQLTRLSQDLEKKK